MKKINQEVIYKDEKIIAEITVYDEEIDETFYVVCQLGELFYNTYKSSYIDYVSNGGEPPVMLEGDTYMWYCAYDDRFEEPPTRFFDYYEEALSLANRMEKKVFVNEKYKSIRKPRKKLNPEVIGKVTFGEDVGPCCGGTCWNLLCRIPKDGKILLVSTTDLCDYYMICEQEHLPTAQDEPLAPPFEEYEEFEETSNSQYYELFYLLERYRDGLLK